MIAFKPPSRLISSNKEDTETKKLLNDLAQRLKSTEHSAERYEMKYQDSLKTINSLKIGIQSIFNKIGCNTSAMSEMLADSMVTEANMMQYLGMIEQRTNEILQLYAKGMQNIYKTLLSIDVPYITYYVRVIFVCVTYDFHMFLIVVFVKCWSPLKLFQMVVHKLHLKGILSIIQIDQMSNTTVL